MVIRAFIRLSVIAGLLCLGAAAQLSAAAFPYPQNRTYPFGTKPVPFGANANADAATILSKYNTWKSGHVVSAGAGMLRVQRDSADGNDTVSEGISYGMVLAVYFNDQSTFDQLWAYKQSKNDGFGLMNWKISSGGGVIGANSATDADEDIAYSLYLANQQWGSAGALNYKSLADAETAKLIGYSLDTNRIKPGDSFNDCRYPSYFFPNEYRIFSNEKPADLGTWNAVRANCYNTLVAARNGSTGLVPEQCNDTGGAGGCGVSQANNYYYNSARVPLRLAIDYVYYGDPTAAAQLTLLAGFFGGISGGPGGMVDCYTPSGGTCSGFNSGAFVGPAGTAFMRTGGANLQTFYNYLMADGTYPTRYFDGAIGIWSLLLLSGNLPNIGDPSSIYTPTATSTVTPYAGTPTFTATTTPIAFSYIFEDFENAILVNSYNYTGSAAGPTLSSGISSLQKFGGTYSDLVQVALPAAANYGGHGFDSSYAPASGVMNFTGATAVRFYVRSDKAVSVRIAFREGAGIAGGDDEVWQSSFTAIPGTNAWTAVTIPISAFTENIYNPSCSPSCLTTGNNVFNLSSVKACEVSFNPIIGAPAANVYIDDISFIPSVVPTMTPTKTPFSNPFTLIYDDFENPLSLATGVPQRVTTYANTVMAASASWGLDSAAPLVGLKSGRLNYNLGTAGSSYGAGGSFISPYSTGVFTSPNAMAGRTVDATGAVSLTMWIKADLNLKFRLTFQEAGTLAAPVGASDGESWYSALYTGTGAWQKLTVDINEFVEDPYNTLCNPTGIAAPGPCITGATAGNNTPNLNAIWQVGIKLPGEQVGVSSRTGTVFFDDVAFITSYRTATPSPSTTPGGASPTPTLSPSPSASATATRTASASVTPTLSATPSASPSATLTASSTPTGSPTNPATSTKTQTVTPPANTPSYTNTATGTGTFTPTSTASPSPSSSASGTVTVVLPSFTTTNTPLPGSTRTFTSTISTTRSNTPSNTPSSSPTPTVTGTFTSSVSATPSVTATSTPSYSATVTGQISSTFTPSASATGTAVLPSATSTVVLATATMTDTPGLGVTNTNTDTATTTSTVTAIYTLTNTVTVSASSTTTDTTVATAIPSSTDTPVPSFTATPLVVASGTFTQTVTAMPTATATLTLGPGASSTPIIFATWTVDTESNVGPIVSTLPAPNPNPTGLMVKLNRAVDRLSVKVYTKAMILVDKGTSGAFGPGWVRLPLPIGFVSHATAGSYYYVVTAEKNGSNSHAQGTGKLVILP